jgi:hypothetical protein
MNCHESRTILDSAAPQWRDAAEPNVRDAASHAQSCAECSSWLQAVDGFDRWVAPAFRGVPVPEGLRDRLLQSLVTAPAAAQVQPAAKSRRTLLIWTSIAAALLIGAGLMVFTQNPATTPELTLAAACEKLDAERPFTSLKAFDGSFAPKLPARWGRWVTGSAMGVDIDAAAGHDAAIYRFAAGKYTGYLVVIAPGRVSDPPEISIPHASQYDYDSQRVSWTSDNQVVVCYLDADGPRMEDFLRELYPQSA